MKNYVSAGDTLVITAAAALKSGDGVLVGAAFGVATGDIALGTTGVIALSGVFDLPKIASQAWTVGQKVYWDGAASRCTGTASGNKLIGFADLEVGSGSTEILGRVKLNEAVV